VKSVVSACEVHDLRCLEKIIVEGKRKKRTDPLIKKMLVKGVTSI